MAIFFPALDMILGFLILTGSPGIGYVVLRCVVISSKYWQGWKRLVVASVIGVGWALTIFWIFSPLLQTSVRPSVIAEYFAYAGAGLFFLTALASLTNRLIISRALASYFPRTISTTSSRAPSIPAALRGKEQTIYKPAQLRAHPTNTPSPFQEPTLENDVLSLLKQENFDAHQKEKKASP